MSLMVILNILCPILAVLGMYLMGKQNKIGFVVFIVVDLSSIYISILTEQYGILLMGVLYVITEVYAYYKWHKKEMEQL